MDNIVKGKNGIQAQVVQHSISPEGKEVVTFNVKYGLIVHAEELRHRLFSNSVKSNRAIPTKKIRKEVLNNPYVPIYLGKNQPGMKADGEVKHKYLAKHLWLIARYPAVFFHWLCEKVGGHKEWTNRLLNPWQYVEQTITATEWANFWALRLHEDAQKDIQELARVMKEAKDNSSPMEIKSGEFHVPYVQREREDGVLKYYDNDGSELSVEQAIKASAARVARSSYNNHNNSNASYSKDESLYNILIESKPSHASPVEAQCSPMKGGWEDGVTHIDKNGDSWSGNLKGWIQARQLLEDHTVWEEE